ncbi:MAG: hypothetical protein ABUK01_01105 [Leptospirales bacterium]
MNYIDLLDEAKVKKTEIGYEGFELFQSDIIDEEQAGYSFDLDGNDLTGEEDGKWRKEWIVVGRDTSLGDPLLIDTSKKEFPLYTAVHGEESWDPVLLSPSLERFLKSLEILRKLETEFHRVKETKDVAAFESMRGLSLIEILRLNEGCDDSFWEEMFDRLIEEVEEVLEFG